LGNITTPILRPISQIYRGIAFLRNKAYDLKLLRVGKLDKPVISIGNISFGGSGKTPLVRYIAEKLLAKGFKPGILTRGYHRRRKEDVVFVSPPSEGITSYDIGDEPFMLARQLSGAVFGISANRLRVGRRIIREFDIDIFILDDGFQRRKLYRDIDIVVLDTNRDSEGDRFISYGLLRESLSSLVRADIIVLRGVGSDVKSDELKNKIHRFNTSAKIIETSIEPKNVLSIDGKRVKPISYLRGKKVLAFCGIAQPNNFKSLLIELGVEIKSFIEFKDHHFYNRKDMNRIASLFLSCGAEICLSTAKDAAKIWEMDIDFPLYVVDIDYNFNCDDADLILLLITNIIGKT